MSRAITPLTVVLLMSGMWACGATHTQTDSTAVTVSTFPSALSATPAHDNLQAGYDTDDHIVRNDGHTADRADAAAIAALVKRYYAYGASGDGAAACALTSPSLAGTVPEAYGQELGSAIPVGAERFLHGAKTCAAVLSLLFGHLHGQFAAAVEMIGVRLKGDFGYALVDSTTLPASMIEVAREGGIWKIDELLGRPLP
jgi:hypothetical protein